MLAHEEAAFLQQLLDLFPENYAEGSDEIPSMFSYLERFHALSSRKIIIFFEFMMMVINAGAAKGRPDFKAELQSHMAIFVRDFMAFGYDSPEVVMNEIHALQGDLGILWQDQVSLQKEAQDGLSELQGALKDFSFKDKDKDKDKDKEVGELSFLNGSLLDHSGLFSPGKDLNASMISNGIHQEGEDPEDPYYVFKSRPNHFGSFPEALKITNDFKMALDLFFKNYGAIVAQSFGECFSQFKEASAEKVIQQSCDNIKKKGAQGCLSDDQELVALVRYCYMSWKESRLYGHGLPIFRLAEEGVLGPDDIQAVATSIIEFLSSNEADLKLFVERFLLQAMLYRWLDKDPGRLIRKDSLVKSAPSEAPRSWTAKIEVMARTLRSELSNEGVDLSGEAQMRTFFRTLFMHFSALFFDPNIKKIAELMGCSPAFELFCCQQIFSFWKHTDRANQAIFLVAAGLAEGKARQLFEPVKKASGFSIFSGALSSKPSEQWLVLSAFFSNNRQIGPEILEGFLATKLLPPEEVFETTLNHLREDLSASMRLGGASSIMLIPNGRSSN